MKFLPIIVFFLILAAAGAYYVFVMMPSRGESPAPSAPIENPGQNVSVSNPAQQASGPTDCGTDMDCFIRAASTCQAANVTRASTVDLLGTVVSGATYMEIRNTSDAGKCPLYMLTANSSAKLSDSAVATALAKGIPASDISRQEAEYARQAKASIGLNGTCKYGAAELSAILLNWKAGLFAGSDYAGAECSGRMFDGLTPTGGFSANLTLKNITASKNGTTVKSNASAKTNATSKTNTTAKTNTTMQANSSVSNATKANATAPAAKNATVQANASSAAASFHYTSKYTAYFPEHLAWFCANRSSEFYRMHWKEYFGGGCSAPKPNEGFVDLDNYTATGCTLIPCCVDGPNSEYSRSYDYFECGYN